MSSDEKNKIFFIKKIFMNENELQNSSLMKRKFYSKIFLKV